MKSLFPRTLFYRKWQQSIQSCLSFIYLVCHCCTHPVVCLYGILIPRLTFPPAVLLPWSSFFAILFCGFGTKLWLDFLTCATCTQVVLSPGQLDILSVEMFSPKDKPGDHWTLVSCFFFEASLYQNKNHHAGWDFDLQSGKKGFIRHTSHPLLLRSIVKTVNWCRFNINILKRSSDMIQFLFYSSKYTFHFV